MLLSIAFVFIAAAISRWQGSDLEKDLAIATLRSFIQLIAIGYVLELVFEMNVPGLHRRHPAGDDHHRRAHQRQPRQADAERRAWWLSWPSASAPG